MTNFMPYKHIVDFVACFLPPRQGKDPCVDVKAGSLNVFALYYQVLCSKQFSKCRFYLV